MKLSNSPLLSYAEGLGGRGEVYSWWRHVRRYTCRVQQILLLLSRQRRLSAPIAWKGGMKQTGVDIKDGRADQSETLIDALLGKVDTQEISSQAADGGSPTMRLEAIAGQRRVDAQLIHQLYKQAPVAIVGSLVNASILVLFLWSLGSHRALLIWLGAAFALAVFRSGLFCAYGQGACEGVPVEWWGRLQAAGIGATGMLWGAAGLYLFPQESTAHQAFLAFVLAGMVAGAVGTCSSVLLAFVVFALPALTPIFVRFLLVGDELHIAMAVMTLLFFVLTFLTARYINVSARELIGLKDHFVDQVAARTGELTRANQVLKREIAEREQAEKSLRETEECIRMVLDHSHVVLWALDRNGTVTLSEGGGLAGLGLKPQEVVGRSFYEAYSAYPQIVLNAREALKGNTVSSVTDLKVSIFENRFGPLTDERGEITGAIVVAIDITAREKAEAQLRSALTEKEVLLKEVHHRVKNNMAVVISLLAMQSSRVADPLAKQALQDCGDRVKAMALVHETLYHFEDFAAIPLASYARTLSDNLIQIMSAGQRGAGIRVTIDADGVRLPIDQAMPCGLILNELITNALKHAFPGQSGGQIHISAQFSETGVFELRVRDNGVGLVSDLNPENCNTLGFRIISALVEHQMDGHWQVSNANGACFTIQWPTRIMNNKSL